MSEKARLKAIERIMRWNIDEIDLTQFPADLFQPAPDNWKQILKLPPYMKKA